MTDNAPIRVMIVDDSDSVRWGLQIAFLTQPNMIVVGEAANGEDAVQRFEQFKPHVVLMDYRMPNMDGITAARLIKERDPNVTIIVLAADLEGADKEKALRNGVSAFLTKTGSFEAVAATILALKARPD